MASLNPTRSVRALTQLAHYDEVPIDDLLGATFDQWQSAPKLIDRWLRAQSGSRRSDTVERVVALAHGPLYDRSDRSRVMGVWFPFATRNRSVFHRASGAGYRAFVDELGELLPLNAGLAVRLVGDLLQFRRFDPARQALLRAELERMVAMPGMPDFAVGIVQQLLVPGRGLEPLYAAPKTAVLPLNDPGKNGAEASGTIACESHAGFGRGFGEGCAPDSVPRAMGSLIKKRRKRMRKKKHKKMLRRTRHARQRGKG